MSATMDSVQAEIAYRRQQVRRSAARTVRTENRGRSKGTDRPRRS